MPKLTIDDIDFGDNDSPVTPFEMRGHVAFLIGSGFSVPCGMPTGRQMNDAVFNIENSLITFDFSGNLAVSDDGKKHSTNSPYEHCLVFCSLAMKEYSKREVFDYEEFYDFINGKEIFDASYVNIAKPFLPSFIDYDQLIFNLKTVYNKIIEYKLKEGRKTEIMEGEHACDKFRPYERFVKYIDKLSHEYVVDIHSLNHDLLIENLYRTGWLHEGISDGFHNYRSPFYGELKRGGLKFDCRLEEYKAYYNKAIRLYKLHGSLDYLMFHRQDNNGFFVKDKMIKVPYGIGIDKTKKQDKKRLGYIEDWIEYSHDFLSGTFSKRNHYNDRFYNKLFKRFKDNLKKAESLIVIGYGGRDAGINEIIFDYFDYRNKRSYIIDPFYDKNEELQIFGNKIGAEPILKSIVDFEDINWNK